MATYLLVHGAWHGGWCWARVSRLLRDAGHTVHTPTLTGLGGRAHLATPEVDLECHINDVLGVVEAEHNPFRFVEFETVACGRLDQRVDPIGGQTFADNELADIVDQRGRADHRGDRIRCLLANGLSGDRSGEAVPPEGIGVEPVGGKRDGEL